MKIERRTHHRPQAHVAFIRSRPAPAQSTEDERQGRRKSTPRVMPRASQIRTAGLDAAPAVRLRYRSIGTGSRTPNVARRPTAAPNIT